MLGRELGTAEVAGELHIENDELRGTVLVRAERGCRANDESKTKNEWSRHASMLRRHLWPGRSAQPSRPRLLAGGDLVVQLLRAFGLFLHGEALILFQAHEIDQRARDFFLGSV